MAMVMINSTIRNVDACHFTPVLLLHVDGIDKLRHTGCAAGATTTTETTTATAAATTVLGRQRCAVLGPFPLGLWDFPSLGAPLLGSTYGLGEPSCC